MADIIDNNVVGNIDLSALKKKRFTIDGDENRIIELDTSDIMITSRLAEAYPKIEDLLKRVQNIPTVEDNTDDINTMVNGLSQFGKNLKEIDTEMRQLIDYIFDAPVSEVCAPTGSMYDPKQGSFRAEIIIDVLMQLYENDIKAETKKIKSRIDKHTSKYTKSRE